MMFQINNIIFAQDENDENINCIVELKLFNNNNWSINLYDSKNRHFNLNKKYDKNDYYNFDYYYNLFLNEQLNIKYDNYEDCVFVYLDINDKNNCLIMIDDTIDTDYLMQKFKSINI